MHCTAAPYKCITILLGTIEYFYNLSHQDSLLWPDVSGNRHENDFRLIAVLQIYSFKEQTCHKDFPLRRHPHVCSESDSGYHVVVRDSLQSQPVFPQTPKVLRNEYGSSSFIQPADVLVIFSDSSTTLGKSWSYDLD